MRVLLLHLSRLPERSPCIEDARRVRVLSSQGFSIVETPSPRPSPASGRGGAQALLDRARSKLITPYNETPGGMSASVTPTSSILVMIALRMKPRPLLKSIQVLT